MVPFVCQFAPDLVYSEKFLTVVFDSKWDKRSSVVFSVFPIRPYKSSYLQKLNWVYLTILLSICSRLAKSEWNRLIEKWVAAVLLSQF
jgi:hypothetical protein